MDPPPAKNRASKRRERRRRRAAAAAATEGGPDVLAAERGSTAPGNAAAAASSSRRRNHRRKRQRQRDRAAKAAAAAEEEALKSPEAPDSALRGECTGALGNVHDIANCVPVVASVQGDSSLQSGCCLEAVETTSHDCPVLNGADDSGLVRMVSENSCLRPMTNSVSVDNAKTKGEIVNLDRAIDKRCELGKINLDCTSTERNGLQEQDAAFSEDNNANCLSPSSLAEAYAEKLKNVFSPRRSFIGFPKKKLLILDLNGLLADINQDYHNACMADAKVRGKLVFRRPYCDDFLKFCSWNFDLGIWSSRKKENVASVVDIVMRDFKPRLLFCWDMSKCTFTGHKTLENMHKPLMLKELKKLWNKEEPDLPWEEGDYSPSNTLLVDDSPYKALRNPPHTAIFPRPYSYLNRNDNSLGPGGDLRMYLQNLAAADDVESYVRNNPFGQSFITESDPHWNFYAQIAGNRNAVAHNGASPLLCLNFPGRGAVQYSSTLVMGEGT